MNSADYLKLQKEAMHLLTDYEIDTIPIDIYNLVNKMNIKLVPYSEFCDIEHNLLMKQSKDGFFVFDEKNDRFEIFYNDDKNETRIKFTLGHEISHIIHLDTYENETIKAKANYFSRFLIVPIPLIRELNLTNKADVGYIFQVSPDVAQYSLEFYNRNIVKFDNDDMDYIEFVKLFNNSIEKCRKELKASRDLFYDEVINYWDI